MNDLLTVTDSALEQIRSILKTKDLADMAVRVRVLDLTGRRYNLQFVEQSEKREDDVVVEAGDIRFYIDQDSGRKITGATLEFIDEVSGSGFRLNNPNQAALSDPMAARVQALIDDKITPAVAQHGGTVTLIDVKEGTVYVELGGGCQGCGMANETLKQGIETMLREEIPEISEVLDTTDHAQGTNPYYRPSA